MGYIPPYIPDTLLETLKYIPSRTKGVQKVAAIEKKDINKYRLQSTMRHKDIYSHPYKRKYFDQYV